MDPARRPHAGQRAQELRVPGRQVRRQVPLGQEPPMTVDVGQEGVGQAGALDDAGFDAGPFAPVEDEGQDVEVPRPGRAAGVVVDVVGDAVVADQPAHAAVAPLQLRPVDPGEFGQERAPVRPHRAVRRQHGIVTPGRPRIGFEYARARDRRLRQVGVGVSVHPGAMPERDRSRGRLASWTVLGMAQWNRRRSSVSGKSGWMSGGPGSNRPPVRPKGSNRASRRPSAS